MSTVATYAELIKPRISGLVLFTTAAGLWLAQARPSVPVVLLTLAGAAMVVQAVDPAGEREARRNIVVYTIATIDCPHPV